MTAPKMHLAALALDKDKRSAKAMPNRKAQASTEMLIVIAICIVLLIILANSFGAHISSISSISQIELTRAALEDINAAGIEVLQSGIGSQKNAEITLPADVSEFSANGKELQITYRSGKTMQKTLSYTARGSMHLSIGKNYIFAKSTTEGVCFGNSSAC